VAGAKGYVLAIGRANVRFGPFAAARFFVISAGFAAIAAGHLLTMNARFAQSSRSHFVVHEGN
jgi:hypothetical protein